MKTIDIPLSPELALPLEKQEFLSPSASGNPSKTMDAIHQTLEEMKREAARETGAAVVVGKMVHRALKELGNRQEESFENIMSAIGPVSDRAEILEGLVSDLLEHARSEEAKDTLGQIAMDLEECLTKIKELVALNIQTERQREELAQERSGLLLESMTLALKEYSQKGRATENLLFGLIFGFLFFISAAVLWIAAKLS